MNDEYSKTIEMMGKTYHYDPDYDCWYRVFSRAEYDELSHWTKFGWIYISLACLVFAGIMTYVQA